MSYERTIYCDREGCEIHQHTARPIPDLPPGWILLYEHSDRTREFHLCGWQCVMHFAAKIPPPKIISADDGEDELFHPSRDG